MNTETAPSIDLVEVHAANKRAAICQDYPVTWLANGPNGETLPRELASQGYHICSK